MCIGAVQPKRVLRTGGKDARPLEAEVGIFSCKENGKGRAAEARTQGYPRRGRASLLGALTVLYKYKLFLVFVISVSSVLELFGYGAGKYQSVVGLVLAFLGFLGGPPPPLGGHT